MFDKRSYTRYILNGSVNFRTENNISNTIRADLIDMSFLGFSIFFKEVIEIGTNLEFELETQLMQDPLVGKGKVKNFRETIMFGMPGFKIGVEFTEVNKDSLEFLLHKIQARVCAEKRKMWQSGNPYFGPY